MQQRARCKGYAQTIKTLGGLALIGILFLLSACATIPVEQRPQVRKELESTADKVLAEFFTADPAIEAAFHKSPGYFVGEAAMGMVALVGSTASIGVLYDRQKDKRAFLNINTFDLGLGAGGSDFKLLVLFKTTEALEKVKKGFSFGGPTSAAMVRTRGGVASMEREGWTSHVISISGFTFGGAYTRTKVEINRELTDLGITDVGLPNKGLIKKDDQGKAAPRKWDRALPFLAQKVIDKGFDLPLPLGIGLTVADVKQKMDLTDIYVGFNGSPKQRYQAVTFENTATDTRSAQLKLDAWLFPFMNVYVMAGSVDGTIAMDVNLDGNTILNSTGTVCRPGPFPPKQPICRLLENQTFHLPVNTTVDAFTYGVGTTLAAGFNNWFVAIPLAANWVVPNGGVAYGVNKTVTPRGGRIVNLGRLGNITTFGGGTWMESEFKIDGVFDVPGGGTIDYTITETSKDPWNLLLGFNWDFNRRLSWSLEYNGFIGSREATISNFVVRF
jgi:hypothetical protein